GGGAGGGRGRRGRRGGRPVSWSGGWAPGAAAAVAHCVLAPNPGPMTLEGTNTWVLLAPGEGLALVVDPGPDDEGHLVAVLGAVREAGAEVGQVLLTHGHLDHSAGARRVAGLAGPPRRAPGPAP